jgi:hypothetical protein
LSRELPAGGSVGGVEVTMRTFVGMLLGCLLTIAAVYVHDSVATSTVANGMKADTSTMIVNWDVAARRWGDIKESVHTAWLKLQALDDSPSPTKSDAQPSA